MSRTRREFLQSVALGTGVLVSPLTSGAKAEVITDAKNRSRSGPEEDSTVGPRSPIDLLARLGSEVVRKAFTAGPGFAAVVTPQQELKWTLVSPKQLAADAWELTYNAGDDLEAVCRVNVDRECRVGTIQVRLLNASDQPSKPFSRLSAFTLKFENLPSSPRVMTSSGALFDHAYVVAYPGRQAYWTRWDIPLPYHGVSLSSGADGHSTSKDFPTALVSAGLAWDAPGFFFSMEWSGPWEARLNHPGEFGEDGRWLMHWVYQLPRNSLEINIGPKVAGLVLEPKESLELPRVHVGFFEGGFEAGTNALRRYIMKRIIPPYKQRPVVPPVACIQWPGIRSYVEEDIYRQADAAAELGVEFFVYDTEWYGLHPHCIGTWEPDLKKIPRGLEAVSEHVRSKGMGFGLFIDPELASPGTKMLREHPEFFYPPSELPFMHSGSRVVNYGLPEVCDYVVKLVSGLVERYKLTYLHWELDSGLLPLWDRVDPTGKVLFAHYRGLYQVWDELLAKYPNVLMHFAAQGGHRLDLGVLRRSHVCWAYEVQTHPHLCHRMQLGGSLFIPSLYLGCTVGPKPMKEHLGLDAGLPDVSFISRMAATLFVNGFLQNLPPQQAQRTKHWIAVYKKIRHLLVKDYYRLLPQPQSEADWDAGQFCDGMSEGVVFVFRYAGRTERQTLPLRSLEAGSNYSFRNEQSGEARRYTGKTLATQGLPIVLEANSAKLYSYRQISRS